MILNPDFTRPEAPNSNTIAITDYNVLLLIVAGSAVEASGSQRAPLHNGSHAPRTAQCTAGAGQGVQRRADRHQLRCQSVRR